MDRESLDLCDAVSGDTTIALARVKTWVAGDTLTAADLNAEFNNILNNPTSLINLSAAGDVCIVSSAAAVTRLAIGTASQALLVSTGLLPTWGTPVLQSYLAGCQITAITQTSSGTMTHSSGVAVDSTSNTVSMVLSSSLVGTTTGTFVAGNNQPKLDTNSTGLATSQWYHIYVVSSAVGGSTDVLYSSSTSPTMPTGFSKQRRVGSFRTGSTGNIIPMTQDGDYFTWAATIQDVNTNNPGTGAVSRTLTVPSGVNVTSITRWIILDTGVTVTYGLISDLSANDEAPLYTNTNVPYVTSTGSASANTMQLYTRTNTSAQVRSRLSASDANITLTGQTVGWLDPRGRNT